MAGKEECPVGVGRDMQPIYMQLNPTELFLGDKSIILTPKGMVVEGILQRYRVLNSGPLSLAIKEQWKKEIVDGYKELGVSQENLPLLELKRQLSSMVEKKVFRPNLPKKPERLLTRILKLLEW